MIYTYVISRWFIANLHHYLKWVGRLPTPYVEVAFHSPHTKWSLPFYEVVTKSELALEGDAKPPLATVATSSPDAID